MAGVKINLCEFREIRERSLSQQEVEILSILDEAIHGEVQKAATEAALKIDGLCPSLEDEEAVLAFVWSTWDLILSAADSPDTTQGIQEMMMCIIQELVRKERGFVQNDRCLWKDVPLLPDAFEAHCSDPTLDPEDFTIEDAKRYRNISAFGARFLRADVLNVYFDAIVALSTALEWELDDMTPHRVEFASEWIAYASRPLLWWACENIGVVEVYPEDERMFFEGGPLYNGLPAMCLQRWGFWETRFEELAKEESGLSQETRNVAREAAQTMKTVEADVGHTLAKG